MQFPPSNFHFNFLNPIKKRTCVYNEMKIFNTLTAAFAAGFEGLNYSDARNFFHRLNTSSNFMNLFKFITELRWF